MERMTIRPITGHLRTEKSHFLTSFGSPCKVKKTLGTIVCDGIMMMNTSDHNERARSPIPSLASVLIAGKHSTQSSFHAKNWPKTTFSGLTPPRLKGLGPFSASIDTLANTNYHININSGPSPVAR